MKKIAQIIMTGFILLTGAVAASSAHAINVFDGACPDSQSSGVGGGAAAGTNTGTDTGTSTGGDSTSAICGAAKQDDAQNIIKNVINATLMVLGMIAVIMIVIGGIRYTTSNGDASSMKGAKDTILYAVVGLVIAILAYAIVNFVLGQLK